MIPAVKFPLLNPVPLNSVATGQMWQPGNYEAPAKFANKWQQGDILRMQVQINNLAGAVTSHMTLKRCSDGYPEYVFDVDDVQTTLGFNIITFSLTLPAVTGHWFIEFGVSFAGGAYNLFYGEPLDIRAIQTGTMLFKYYCDGIMHDVYFSSPNGTNEFYLRVPGGSRSSDFIPKSIQNIFIDQSNSFTLLSGVPFNTRRVIIGDNYGVPNYIINIVNRILNCENVLIDGVRHSKTSDSQLENAEYSTTWGMGVWRIELAETPNDELVTVWMDEGEEVVELPAEIIELGEIAIHEASEIITIPAISGYFPLSPMAILIDSGGATEIIGVAIDNSLNISINVGNMPVGTYELNILK